MGSERQDIKIVSVCKDEIKINPDEKESWIIPFQLSLKPYESWQNKFNEVQKKNTHDMKRKARIDEDFLRVEVFGEDDLQKILDVLKIEVEETNVLCEEEYQKKIKVRQEVEELQKKQKDTTLKFKADADNLIL